MFKLLKKANKALYNVPHVLSPEHQMPHSFLKPQFSTTGALDATGYVGHFTPTYSSHGAVIIPNRTLSSFRTDTILPYHACPICKHRMSIKLSLDYYVNGLKLFEHRSRVHLENGHLLSTEPFDSCVLFTHLLPQDTPNLLFYKHSTTSTLNSENILM